MMIERFSQDYPTMQAAIAELQELIRGCYPDAHFDVDEGKDSSGIYITAIVDVLDTDEVVDIFIDRLVDLQIADGLPLHVIPVRPVERVLEELREQQPGGRRSALPS